MRHKIPNIVIIHIGLESYVSHVLKYYKIMCVYYNHLYVDWGRKEKKNKKRGKERSCPLKCSVYKKKNKRK